MFKIRDKRVGNRGLDDIGRVTWSDHICSVVIHCGL